jgi:hypothetical protein
MKGQTMKKQTMKKTCNCIYVIESANIKILMYQCNKCYYKIHKKGKHEKAKE